MLRRSLSTSKQRLFNAIHHGFNTAKYTAKSIVSKSTRTAQIIRRQTVPSQAAQSRRVDALDKMKDVGYTLSENWETAMGMYGEYVSLLSRLLDIMTPEEIERRNRSTESYWLRYWQKQKQRDDRQAHFERCLVKIRKARNEFRGRNKKMSKSMRYWKRLDPENNIPQPSWQHERQKQYGNRKSGKYRE